MVANKVGIDDLYYSIQQNGTVNPEDELKRLIDVNTKPYLSSKQVGEILSWVNVRLMDNKGDVATKDIIFNDKAIHALSTLPDTEFQRWVRIFENNGARGFKRELKGLVAEKRRKTDLPFTGPVGLGDAFPMDSDFPVEGEGLLIPKGWRIEASGVFQEKEHDGGVQLLDITFFPIFIISRMVPLEVNADSGELLELTLKLDGVWRRVSAARSALAEARKLVAALTEVGVPITAATAAGLVKFLGDFEKVNREKIPVTCFAEQMGWKGGGRAFVMGNEIFGDKRGIVFYSKDSDVKVLAGGLKICGTLEGWQKNIRTSTANRPKLAFNIAAGIVPMIQNIINCTNFDVDKSGRSSQGKTAGDRVALSTYGDPKILLRSTNLTKYAAENYAYAFCDLPIILDDTHALAQTGDLVYLLVNGIGKGRGAKNGGNQRTKTWRTVILSSGEAPLEMAAAWTGLRGRIITLRNLWGQTTGAEVRAAVAGASEHYGHTAPEVVKYLIQHRESWSKFRQKYRELVNLLAGYCRGVEVAERRCEYFAAVLFAASLADALFELGWNSKEIFTGGKVSGFFGQIFNEVVMTNSGFTTGKAGMDVIRDWIFANKAYFEGGGADTRVQKIFGKWKEGEFVAVYGSQIRQELRNHGINENAVLDELTEKGVCSKKSIRLVREGGARTMLVFDWLKLHEDDTVTGEIDLSDPDNEDIPY